MSEPKTEPKAGVPASAGQAEKSQLPVEAFHEMDRRDESQILAEMRGELIEEFVYSVDIQGRRVTNLSYAGVKEAIRRRGNLEILEARTEETDDEIRALVRVRDHENRIDVRQEWHSAGDSHSRQTRGASDQRAGLCLQVGVHAGDGNAGSAILACWILRFWRTWKRARFRVLCLMDRGALGTVLLSPLTSGMGDLVYQR